MFFCSWCFFFHIFASSSAKLQNSQMYVLFVSFTGFSCFFSLFTCHFFFFFFFFFFLSLFAKCCFCLSVSCLSFSAVLVFLFLWFWLLLLCLLSSPSYLSSFSTCSSSSSSSSSGASAAAFCFFVVFLLCPSSAGKSSFCDVMASHKVRQKVLPTLTRNWPKYVWPAVPTAPACMHAGQLVWGPHQTPPRSQCETPMASKNASFRRPEPLEWRLGIHHAPVKGPPRNAENELSLWPLNRPACGHRASFQIGHFWIFFSFAHFAWNPYFL